MAATVENPWGSRSQVQTLVLMVATAFGIYLCYRLAVPFLPVLLATWSDRANQMKAN